MSDPITRYPLCWPAGRPRTPAHKRERARFHKQTRAYRTYGTGPTATTSSHIERSGITLGQARDELLAELARLGARNVILSTNLTLRNDGLPYANQRQPDDPGGAVYFQHNGRDMAFACDRWTRIEDNLSAIARTIEALRGIERWGTGEMVAAAFEGFTALPAARTAKRRWWQVFGVEAHASSATAVAMYRRKALELHPDRNGGESGPMVELNAAYDEFKKERGL